MRKDKFIFRVKFTDSLRPASNFVFAVVYVHNYYFCVCQTAQPCTTLKSLFSSLVYEYQYVLLGPNSVNPAHQEITVRSTESFEHKRCAGTHY